MIYLLAELQPRQAGIELFVAFAIGIILSAVAARMATQRKPDSPIRDRSKPTTLTERGSYITYLIGRRRIGPVFAWAGQRETRQTSRSSSGGGKGGGGGGDSQTVDVFWEKGLHWLCVGPAWKLQTIWRNGKAFYTRGITRDSHPSGSEVTINAHTFAIYWGEPNQPVNTWLGNSARMGISSRWPGVCYLVWKDARLGQTPIWPQFEYDLETLVEDEDDQINHDNSFLAGTLTLTGPVQNIVAFGGSGSGGVAWFEVAGATSGSASWKKVYTPGRRVQLVGNAHNGGAATDLTVHHATYNSTTKRTKIFWQESLTTHDAAGTLQAYQKNVVDDGINAAHAIDKMLFAPWPRGAGFDPDEDSFDLSTLEDVADLIEDEAIPGSIVVNDGEILGSVLGNVLMDVGVMLFREVSSGDLWFYPVREVADAPTLPAEAILEYPEIDNEHDGTIGSDKIVFSFKDRERKWKDNTFVIDDDGVAGAHQRPSDEQVDLFLALCHTVAGRFGERRSQELLARPTAYNIRANHEALFLFPGQRFFLEGFEPRLLVTEIERLADSSRVTIKAVKDTYSADTAPDAIRGQGGGLEEEYDDLEPDTEVTVAEAPGGGGGGGGAGGAGAWDGPEDPPGVGGMGAGWGMALIPLRIRSNDQVGTAEVYFSRDDLTYTQVGQAPRYHTGGYLLADLPEGDPMVIDQGPEFEILGEDIDQVRDYSGDEISWMLGRQLALIDDELFLLRNITMTSSTTARLDGLVRARGGTARAAHLTGATVYIFHPENVFRVRDALLEPGQTVYVKIQPTGAGQEGVPLDEIDPIQLDLEGKGLKPRAVENLRTAGGTSTFHTGEDVEVRWTYFNPSIPGLGAGVQGFGSPVPCAKPLGCFTLKLFTSGDVLVETITDIDRGSYTITNAALVAAFGSEPSSFKVSVSESAGGYASDATTLTIERT